MMGLTPQELKEIVIGLGGGAVGMAVTIFTIARDNAFVKGQLSEVLRRMDSFQRVAEHVAILDKAHLKTAMDVAHAHDKIRRLDTKGVPNGSARD